MVTVIGNIFSPQPGELIEALGQWVMNKDYGRQFKATDMKSVPPTSLEGITKYLGSGLIRGVGPGFAKLLVDSFGENVFNVIENSPHRLKEVPRLGKARIQTIIQSWKDQKFIRTIMVFLQSHGVSSSRAVRIYKTYGDRAIDVVRENPYCLARDIQGIGFKIADQIALSLGIPLDSLFRARAGLSYVLNQAITQGNCALPEQILLEQTEELLEIPASRISEGLQLEYAERNLIRDVRADEPWAYLAVMFNLETEVAHRFEQSPLMLRKKKTVEEIQTEIQIAQTALKIELADLQKQSVQMALEKRFSIVTGGPGTGKSTLTKVLTKILQDRGLKIILCSPTGRAAKR
ncbi:MAG: ATP-dependent RecD-like DNA helicase, partial [Bdellovibrionales bacterium]|nr:ATP-dependent RecD-like DNA helicase [Bdellovibrionales bacterium]